MAAPSRHLARRNTSLLRTSTTWASGSSTSLTRGTSWSPASRVHQGRAGPPGVDPHRGRAPRIRIGVADGRATDNLLAAREADTPDPTADAGKGAIADGGIVVADDEGEVLEDSDETDEFECHLLPGDYPCTRCYIEESAKWPDDTDVDSEEVQD